MGRPKKSDRDIATATRLIEAAELHFARVGFEAARLQDSRKRWDYPSIFALPLPKKKPSMR